MPGSSLYRLQRAAPPTAALSTTVTFPLDFTTGALPAGVFASGGSDGTLVGADGYQVYSTYAPRFDYTTAGVSRGLLVEPARSQFAGYPGGRTFRGFNTPNCSFTSVANGPSNTSSAALVTANAGTYLYNVDYFNGDSVGTSAVTFYYVAKYSNNQWLWIRDDYNFNGGTTPVWGAFDLLNGVKGNLLDTNSRVDAWGMEPLGNGFYECWITVRPSTSGPGYNSIAIMGNASTPTNANLTLAGTEQIYFAYSGMYLGAHTTPIFTRELYASSRNDDVISFLLPAGVTSLVFTFDDASTQTVTGLTAGTVYTVPTTLNLPRFTTIDNPSAGTTGTLASTEGADSAAISGQLGVIGALAATDVKDSASVSGSVGSSGSLAATDAVDSASLSGLSGALGALTVTDAADTAAFSGQSLLLTGSLAATEGPDVAAISGSLVASGTLISVEAVDVASFAASGVNSGTLSAVEATDAAAFASSVIASGALATTESADTAAFSVALASSGSLTATDPADTASISGVLNILGSLTATETKDVAVFAGSGPAFATLSATEARDASIIISLLSGETEVPREIAVPGINDDSPARINTAIRQIVERLGEYAKLDSPELSGTPVGPTPPLADSSTKLATTAYVKGQDYTTKTYVDGANATQDTAIAGKAATVHTHAESDIINLVADLAAKEPTIAAGTTSQYWRGDKTWQAFPSQVFVGAYAGSYTTTTTTTATMPLSNVAPTSSQGLQIVSLTVTLTSATQRIDVHGSLQFAINGSYAVAAAFCGSTCICTAYQYSGNTQDSLGFVGSYTPGAAGTYTITLRAGPFSGSLFINSAGLGGTLATGLIVYVVEP